MLDVVLGKVSKGFKSDREQQRHVLAVMLTGEAFLATGPFTYVRSLLRM